MGGVNIGGESLGGNNVSNHLRTLITKDGFLIPYSFLADLALLFSLCLLFPYKSVIIEMVKWISFLLEPVMIRNILLGITSLISYLLYIISSYYYLFTLAGGTW